MLTSTLPGTESILAIFFVAKKRRNNLIIRAIPPAIQHFPVVPGLASKHMDAIPTRLGERCAGKEGLVCMPIEAACVCDACYREIILTWIQMPTELMTLLPFFF
jgi:hypothetical protein